MGQMKINGTLGVNEVIVDSWGSRGGSWGPLLFDGQSGRDRERKRGEGEWRLLKFERSGPGVHLSNNATRQCGFPILIKFKRGCFELFPCGSQCFLFDTLNEGKLFLSVRPQCIILSIAIVMLVYI